MKRFLYLISILIIGSACTEVFEAPPQAFLQASFLNSSNKQAISPSVTIWGIGLENLWVKDSVIQEIIFPLTTKESTTYQIKFDSKIDTITFIHQTSQKYASMETGFYYEYKLKSIEYTKHRIDSIQIIDSLVTQKWHENITLYLHPLSAGNN